ncbi:MAG TPA: metal-dependent hydrolase [Gemmataceae bacterium]|jgi:membrane-bound metal-dependent hydrolase YbcI (DUF457 family)|nr:metal-dependent hydrolase [Gemmataceae bacterium]
MAAFKQHVTFSSVLGVGYGLALAKCGMGWVHCALCGALCGVAGMLPDLDSASGRPVRELFGIIAIAIPLLLVQRMENVGVTSEGTVLLGGALYLLIRFGAGWVFKHLTVHRGMFHSLPAAVIAGEIVFLAHDCPEPKGRLALAGGTVLGFLSHLLLDELYAVDARGLQIHLNKAAGSALKLFSKHIPATLGTWLVLGVLTYLVGVEQGLFRPLHFSVNYPRAGRVVTNQQPAPPATTFPLPASSPASPPADTTWHPANTSVAAKAALHENPLRTSNGQDK